MKATFITLALEDGADPHVVETRVTRTKKSLVYPDHGLRPLHVMRQRARGTATSFASSEAVGFSRKDANRSGITSTSGYEPCSRSTITTFGWPLQHSWN